MRIRWAVCLGGALLLAPAAATAQATWDSPMLVPPQGSGGYGVYIIDVNGGTTGVQGTWRSTARPQMLGARLGLAQTRPEPWLEKRLAVFGGVDMAGEIRRATPDMPLDVDWVIGAGLGVGHWTWLSFPGGVSVGGVIDTQSARFLPYATPRLVLDASFGREDITGENIDEMRLDLAFDLGVEVAFQPGWRISFGGTMGSRSALAIGLAFGPMR